MNTERIAWFDFLRGVAILMVVAIHTFAATVGQGEPVDPITVLLRQVLNCAVPLFLAISGYFMAGKSRERSWIRFWKHQIPKVYIPTLIWSVPYLALYLWHGNEWWKGLVLFFACGFSVYYFIALIIQYYLLLPILTNVKRGGVILAFVITMSAIGLVSWLHLIKGYGMSSIVHGGLFPVWLVFFVIGIYLGNRQTRMYSLWPWLLLTVVGLALSYMETEWIYPLHRMGYGIKPSSHLYSLAVIMVLFSRKVQLVFNPSNVLFAFFCRLGRISFGVYLVHCFFILLLTRFFSLNWAELTAAVLFLTMAFIHVARKFVPAIARTVGFF